MVTFSSDYDKLTVKAAWSKLEAAQSELEAARTNVWFDPKQGRQIGLWRLSLAEQAWDRANYEYEAAVA
jgi:hypothetical protein